MSDKCPKCGCKLSTSTTDDKRCCPNHGNMAPQLSGFIADSQTRWDEYFLKMAMLVASKSKDPSTQSGCVIVGPCNEIRSTGYNGLVRGARDDVPARNERPEKYLWYEHSERNAVFNAARSGIALAGCTAYINWHPCSDCTRALIQAGIVRIVTFETPDHLKDRWENHIEVSNQMMCEVGVVYIEYPRPEEKE